MKVWIAKGRNELTGKVSGNMYIIEEEGVRYYYLINILNPNDIYLICKPKSLKDMQEIDYMYIPCELKEFHKKRMEMNDVKNLSTEKISSEIAKQKKEMEEREISKHFVHDRETTKIVMAMIGNQYKDVRIDYIGSNLNVYVIDETWEVKVLREAGSSKRKVSITNIEDQRDKYQRKVRRLVKETRMPWKICRIFFHDFTDQEAIVVLKQLKKDKKTAKEHPEHFDYICKYDYVQDLVERTKVTTLLKLSINNQFKLYDFVFQDN